VGGVFGEPAGILVGSLQCPVAPAVPVGQMAQSVVDGAVWGLLLRHPREMAPSRPGGSLEEEHGSG
jgi:hypothetical protein